MFGRWGKPTTLLGGPRGLSKWVISRVIRTLNGATLILTLLLTDFLSPLGLQVKPPSLAAPFRTSEAMSQGAHQLMTWSAGLLQLDNIGAVILRIGFRARFGAYSTLDRIGNPQSIVYYRYNKEPPKK